MAKPSPQFGGDPVLVALGAEIRRARAGIGLSQETLAVDAESIGVRFQFFFQ